MKGDRNLINLFRSAKYRHEHKIDSFPIYGLELVLGKFGSGKTLTIVNRVFDYLEEFPDCRLISNVQFLEFKDKDNYFFVDCEDKLLPTMIDVLSKDTDKGCLVVIDEVRIFLAKTFALGETMRSNLFLTVLGQCRKLHCLFMLTSQIYSKVPKMLRDFIKDNGDIVICKKFFNGFTYYMYYDMSTIEEDSRINLKGKFKSFDYLIHSPELYEAYDTHSVVASISGLLKEVN